MNIKHVFLKEEALLQGVIRIHKDAEHYCKEYLKAGDI